MIDFTQIPKADLEALSACQVILVVGVGCKGVVTLKFGKDGKHELASDLLARVVELAIRKHVEEVGGAALLKQQMNN